MVTGFATMIDAGQLQMLRDHAALVIEKPVDPRVLFQVGAAARTVYPPPVVPRIKRSAASRNGARSSSSVRGRTIRGKMPT